MNLSIAEILQNTLRTHLHSLVPYATARDEFEGEADVFLDANENPYGSVTAALFNRYPDPYQKELKANIADLKGVSPEQLFLGNGSDEAIDLLIRMCCQPREDEILIMPPTYGMYQVSAGINEVAVVQVPLTPDFQVNTEAVLKNISSHTKLIWLCSPNNPTGNLLERKDMLTILENFDKIVVIDEAYIDFSPQPSWTKSLNAYPNLVVLQTFSKAWGLANLRVGMAFAHPEIIRILNKIKAPYNLNGMTQKLVADSLRNVHFKNEMVHQILVQRDVLKAALLAVPGVEAVLPSDANFLLVKFENAEKTFSYLIDKKIIVRDRSKAKLTAGCLRISVGTEAENNALIQALHEFAVNTNPMPG